MNIFVVSRKALHQETEYLVGAHIAFICLLNEDQVNILPPLQLKASRTNIVQE